MRYIDRQTFNNMSPSAKKKLIGNFFYNNKYLIFEQGDEKEWGVLVDEINEKGRENVKIDKYLSTHKPTEQKNLPKTIKKPKKVPDALEIDQIIDKLKKGGSSNLKELSKVIVYLYDNRTK